MRFIVDAQLPHALARLLTSHGHHAEHVADIGLRDAEDSPIWSYALQQDAVIITKDDDFPHRLSQSRNGPTIVWLRLGNATRAALLQWFEPLLPQILQSIQEGNRLVEVR
jgi:predicted nuclease of predicted toxin-antitoxin system